MLLNRGELDGKRVLKPESVALMMRDHLGDIPAGNLLLGTSGFGLGLAVIAQDTGAGGPGTCWWGGAAGTGFWIDPEARVTGVFMIQNMMELLHADTFRADVYAALGR
jgi:CubicO group peptidase (beta-lactamase class C family)